MLIRKLFTVTLALVLAAASQLLAQSPSKSNKKNIAVKVSQGKVAKDSNVFLFPDFFQHGLEKKGDTTFGYEYFDKDLNKIKLYDLKNVDNIDHVDYFKIFCRFPRVANSNVSPPTEYIKQCEYAHPDTDLWLRYDPLTGEITRYNLYKSKIVGADSMTVTDPVTHNKRNLLFKYFKTEIQSKDSGGKH